MARSFPATPLTTAMGRAARVEYQRRRVVRILQQLGTGGTQARTHGHSRRQVERVAGAYGYREVVRQLTRVDRAAQPLLDEGHRLRIGLNEEIADRRVIDRRRDAHQETARRGTLRRRALHGMGE